MLTVNNYVRAATIEEAYELNQKKSNRVMGGMLWLRMGSRPIQTMIDLSDLGLDTIEETDLAFSIGAMVSLRMLETHSGLDLYTKGAVKESLRHIVGVQFRNLATVGGSIFSRFGFSDVTTMFLAMETEVELFHKGRMPLADFLNTPRDRDILLRLIVKKTPGNFVYLSQRMTKTDFPILTCAVSDLGGVRACVGARPGIAQMVTDERGCFSQGITQKSAQEFGRYVKDGLAFQSNMRASGQYRGHLAEVLVKRACLMLGGQNNEG